jgi:hypothetical protein
VSEEEGQTHEMGKDIKLYRRKKNEMSDDTMKEIIAT